MIAKICIDDLCFFTDGFTKDYGVYKRRDNKCQ